MCTPHVDEHHWGGVVELPHADPTVGEQDVP
jgi:hypothetical protein